MVYSLLIWTVLEDYVSAGTRLKLSEKFKLECHLTFLECDLGIGWLIHRTGVCRGEVWCFPLGFSCCRSRQNHCDWSSRPHHLVGGLHQAGAFRAGLNLIWHLKNLQNSNQRSRAFKKKGGSTTRVIPIQYTHGWLGLHNYVLVSYCSVTSHTK